MLIVYRQTVVEYCKYFHIHRESIHIEKEKNNLQKFQSLTEIRKQVHKNEAFWNIWYRNYVLRYKSLQMQEILKWIIAWCKQVEVFCPYAYETPKVSEKMFHPLGNRARLLAPLSYERNIPEKLELPSKGTGIFTALKMTYMFANVFYWKIGTSSAIQLLLLKRSVLTKHDEKFIPDKRRA